MEVLNDELWTLDIARDIIFPPIHLSYKKLQPAVKRCFTYCAIYPKDSEIKADTLIKMWMALGYLSSESTKEMEQIGRRYLKNLVACSLLQDVKEDDLTGQIVSCKMHDIIHDFAQYVTKGECVTVTAANFVDKGVSYSIARHLALRDHSALRDRSALRDLFSNFGVENLKKLRSFITDPDPNFITDSDLSQGGTLECVRVLNLSKCGLKEVPPEIAKLFHLRYLDLTGNDDIREVPKSLCHLYFLQTLILDGCFRLFKLPEEIYELKNLRHLSLEGFDDPPFLPQGVEKLTCLRTLTCFRAERGGAKLGCLKNLNQFEGRLEICIYNLNEESDAIEAQSAELKNKTCLETLGLHLHARGEVRRDVIEALQPPPNLLRLLLIGFGVEFQNWISTSLKKLKDLNIERCRSLPPSGNLQSLESLSILFLADKKYMGHEFLTLKVKVLEFNSCYDWTEWEDIREEEENGVSIMLNLMTLKVQSCPNLKSLPHRLLRNAPLVHLDISGSNLIIEQYKSGKLRDGFLSPMCEVTH